MKPHRVLGTSFVNFAGFVERLSTRSSEQMTSIGFRVVRRCHAAA